MENQRINIFCATDKNYVALCGIMLTSLLENNKNFSFNIFIIIDFIDNSDLIRLQKLENKYNVNIKLIPVSKKHFEECPIRETDHLSKAAYFRLMASSLLPLEIDKALYLDCDLIINSSLDTLWHTPIDGFAAIAMKDAEFNNPEFHERLGLNTESTYFNSGVMVINLQHWRDNNVQTKFFNCVSSLKDRLLYHDQDVLNIILENQVKIAPIGFNFQTPFLFKSFWHKYLEANIESEITDAIQNPVIIHYTGSHKPWNGNSNHPYKYYFQYYKKRSPWKKTKLKKTALKLSQIKQLVYNYFMYDFFHFNNPSYLIKTQRK